MYAFPARPLRLSACLSWAKRGGSKEQFSQLLINDKMSDTSFQHPKIDSALGPRRAGSRLRSRQRVSCEMPF